MPAVSDLNLHFKQQSEDDSLLSITPLISAFQRGMAFPRLTGFLMMGECRIDDEMGRALVDALAGAACAPLLRALVLYSCDFDIHTAAVLGMHLGQDAFPNLKLLNLGSNPRIGSDGVSALLAIYA